MKTKRLLAALTAVSLLLCGCQSLDTYDAEFNTQEKAQDPEAGSAIPLGEDTLTTTVRSEKLETDILGFAWQFTPTAEGFVCLGDSGSDGTHIFHFNNNTSECSETILTPLASYDGYYYMGSLVDFWEDRYYGFAIMENHSNMEPPQEGDEDFDPELWNSTWESDYYLCTYAPDGTLTEKVKIEGLEAYKDEYGYDHFGDFYCDGENAFLCLWSGEVLRIKSDGTLEETVPAKEITFEISPGPIEITRDRDGNPVSYTTWSETEADMTITQYASVSDFDLKTGKPGEPFFTDETEEMEFRVSAGSGDYRLYVNVKQWTDTSSTEKVYGIKDDGTKEVVIDWDASDMEGMKDLVPLPDGTFIGQDNSSQLHRVTRKYASEIKAKQTIEIGVLGSDYYVREFAREFNRSHEDCQLHIVTYQNSDGTRLGDPEGKQDALDVMKLAVGSDDAPDLILMEGSSDYYGSVDYHDMFLRLGARGVFCDLNEFMENDAEVNRDTILPNILTAMSHPNGALYSLTPSFSIRSIAVKSKFTDKENWTIDDMIDLYEGADDIMYYWSTKQEMLRLIMTGTDFTDEVNGTCNFDSPEFIKILEFCNRYPLESNCPESNKDDPVQYEKYTKWLTDSYYRYQEDTDYLYFTGFSAFAGGGMASRWAYTKGDLGDDFTLVGYPSDNGQGGKIEAHSEIAILSTCEDKAAAWEVVRAYVIRPDAASDPEMGYSIFDDIIEEQLDNEMYIYDWNGRSDLEYYDDDCRVYPLTQEERDGLDAYIRNCNTYMMLDEKVENIIYEEAGMYFSGDRSAEDTAKMIQSRAELYLAEQS